MGARVDKFLVLFERLVVALERPQWYYTMPSTSAPIWTDPLYPGIGTSAPWIGNPQITYTTCETKGVVS